MPKTITDRAKQGQVFFELPADRIAPVASVLVNGATKPFTSTPNGVYLTTPANQNDTVAITFTTQY